MPRKNVAFSFVALAALGLATGCEKQSPWVTVTAGGVVVKARATKYCRDNGKCNESTEKPVIYVKPGDTLGIDVPRSVAENGWRIETGQPGPYSYDHYRAIPIGTQFQSGAELDLRIVRDPKHGEGVWNFSVRVK